MTKLEKCRRRVNDAFRDALHTEFNSKFGTELSTTFNLVSMSLVSYRTDGEDLTKEQYEFVSAYSIGYATAMNQIAE